MTYDDRPDPADPSLVVAARADREDCSAHRKPIRATPARKKHWTEMGPASGPPSDPDFRMEG